MIMVTYSEWTRFAKCWMSGGPQLSDFGCYAVFGPTFVELQNFSGQSAPYNEINPGYGPLSRNTLEVFKMGCYVSMCKQPKN